MKGTELRVGDTIYKLKESVIGDLKLYRTQVTNVTPAYVWIKKSRGWRYRTRISITTFEAALSPDEAADLWLKMRHRSIIRAEQELERMKREEKHIEELRETKKLGTLLEESD
jgi:hypothetical protein